MTALPPPRPTRTATVALALTILAMALPAPSARANEDLWGFLYGPDTAPQGQCAIFTRWSEAAEGEDPGVELAFELEHGFTDRFQGTLALAARRHDLESVRRLEKAERFGFDGAQLSFRFRILSPETSPIGLAVDLEPGYERALTPEGTRVETWGYATRLLAQKTFAAERLAVASNLEVAHGFSREGDAAEARRELVGAWSTGVSWRLRAGWYAGMELVGQAEFPGHLLDDFDHGTWFAGPNLHYGGSRWWATLTVLPRIAHWSPEDEEHAALAAHERIETRLSLGLVL